MTADPATLSVSQLKEELTRKYGVTDFSEYLYKEDLVKRVVESRGANAEIVTGGWNFGEVLQVGNKVNPTGIVTISHGLGDSASGWEDVAKELAAAHRHLLFVLPTAAKIPVTINMNQVMNAWYDIKALGNPNAPQDPNILISAAYVTSLAHHLANKYRVDAKRIIYGGFSQGAALSLVSGLTAPVRPAAVMMLSGYFAAAEHVVPKMVQSDFPLLMCHGTQDNVLPIKLAEMSKAKLEAMGFRGIEYHTYPMAHSVHPNEVQVISKFIATHLP